MTDRDLTIHYAVQEIMAIKSKEFMDGIGAIVQFIGPLPTFMIEVCNNKTEAMKKIQRFSIAITAIYGSIVFAEKAAEAIRGICGLSSQSCA